MAPQKKSMNPVLTALLVVVIGLLILQFAGVIDVTGFLNPQSEKYLDFWGIFGLGENDNNYPGICPISSNQTDHPCCTTSAGEGIQPTVQSIYVPISCNCTTDTHFLEIAPEGNYKLYRICECNDCAD